MRSIFLAITIVLVVAAGPASLAAQQAIGNAHRHALRIDGSHIDDPCDSILANPAGRAVMVVAHRRSKNEQ